MRVKFCNTPEGQKLAKAIHTLRRKGFSWDGCAVELHKLGHHTCKGIRFFNTGNVFNLHRQVYGPKKTTVNCPPATFHSGI